MLTEKPWKPEAVMQILAGLMLSWSVGLLIAASLSHFLPKQSRDLLPFFHFVLSTFSFQGVALVLGHHFLKQHELTWGEFLGLTDGQVKRAVSVALMAGVVLVPAALALNTLLAEAMSLLRMEPVEQVAIKVVQANEAWWQRLSLGVTTIVVAPLAEEMIFRGILYSFIKQLGHPKLALYGTALLFAAAHTNLLIFLPLACLGVALALLYERTNKLLTSVVTHSFFNAVNFCILAFHDEFGRFFQALRERI
jgi:membrane protease YdiL (CAAX protease family)